MGMAVGLSVFMPPSPVGTTTTSGALFMSFVLVHQISQVEALPDGTLISWLPVMDDPTSEAVAYLRKTQNLDHDSRAFGRTEVWLSPGNGWSPEPLDVLRFPVRIILLGVPQPGDYVPDEYLTSTDDDIFVDPAAVSGIIPQTEWPTISGGTYPRDVALQAATMVMQGRAGPVATDTVLDMADQFADWLTRDAQADVINDLVTRGVVTRIDRDQTAYFAGGPING